MTRALSRSLKPLNSSNSASSSIFQVRLPTKSVVPFSESSDLTFLAGASVSSSALRFLDGASASDFASEAESESESDPSESDPSESDPSESSEDYRKNINIHGRWEEAESG